MSIQSDRKFTYIAFGYTILSEIEITELTATNINEQLLNKIDIVIKFGNLAQLWDRVCIPEYQYVANKDYILFNIDGLAVYCIEEGKRIIVSPYEGANGGDLDKYILSSCMSAILLQRNQIPLHGSAININGKAYAFIGDSGAGKSTLAASFINKGYKLLGDDLAVVSFLDFNKPYITPSYPSQKIWDDSLLILGKKSKDYKLLHGNNKRTKYMVPVEHYFSKGNLPLAGIFELVRTDNDEIKLHPIEGLMRVRTLFNHTFRQLFIKPMGLAEWHFKQSASIINQISIYQIQRPLSKSTADELVSVILSTIDSGSKMAVSEL